MKDENIKLLYIIIIYKFIQYLCKNNLQLASGITLLAKNL